MDIENTASDVVLLHNSDYQRLLAAGEGGSVEINGNTIVYYEAWDNAGKYVVVRDDSVEPAPDSIAVFDGSGWLYTNNINLDDASIDDKAVVNKDVLRASLANKQDTLVNGANIKTINNQVILGSGNMVIDTAKYDAEQNEITATYTKKAVMQTTPVDIGFDITPSATGVSITHNKKNIVTGDTSSEQDSMPIANGSQVGMMTPEQVEKIEDLESRVGGLEGQNVRLSYSASTNPTTEQIRQFVIDSGYIDTAKWSSISVVIKDTNHIWRYYSNTQLWEDIGLDTVQQASQTAAGIVKGSSTDGKIFVEADGTMSLNGYDTIKDDVDNLSEKITDVAVVTAETWTFTLEDGTVVTKEVCIWTSQQ